MSRIIILTTDFGNKDCYVGAMKGVILNINKEAKIVDITHEVPNQDIKSGAFILLQSSDYFPEGTIHICVVGFGVGSSRKPICVLLSNQQVYIVPDD